MIKGINLIPGEITAEWRRKKITKVFALVAFCYLVILAGIYWSQRSTLAGVRAEVRSLASAKAALAEKSAEYASLQKRLGEIRQAESVIGKRLEVASRLTQKRVSWSYILRHLSREVPSGVWLRSLSTSDVEKTGQKKVRFLGSALSNKSVAEFIFMLENTGYFKDVTMGYSQKRDFDSNVVFDFELSVLLEKTEEVMSGW